MAAAYCPEPVMPSTADGAPFEGHDCHTINKL